jgi:anti-sigma factor RsiW
MNDCMNAEIRDQLPDLVHDRLAASRRREILAHVASCADCRDEIELLRAARAMFDRQTPRVDLHYIVNALPLAKPRAVRVERRRPMWTDWRIAAAVTLLVAGGSSLAVMSRGRAGAGAAAIQDSVRGSLPVATARPATSSRPRVQPVPTPRAESTPSTVVASEDQGIGASRLSDLSEQQLQTLLGEIDRLQSTPIADPEPVSLRVRESPSGAPEGM